MESLFPIPHPLEYDPSEKQPNYFYDNVAKHLIEPFIRLMETGITINDNAVEDLRSTINQVLDTVTVGLAANPIIQEFQQITAKENYTALEAKQRSKFRTIDYYLKPYDYKKIERRTALVNYYLTSIGKPDLQKPKWTAKDVKLIANYLSDAFLSGNNVENLSPEVDIAKEAMVALAQEKLDIYNKSKLTKLYEATPETLAPPFNPGSSLQKRKLFKHLGILPLKLSKDTGEASWGREQIEELVRTTPKEQTDLHNLLQLFIDYSYGGIIKSNFLEAFDTFTVDGVLKGNFKLFGAKSFRPTSNSPNMLNAPSTGSIYAKPLKKCFIAPEGYLVWSIDFAALEDRVIANLSKDENKIAVFTQGVDGHSLGATYYFKDKVEQILGHQITDHKEAAKQLKQLVDSGNKEAKAIRQAGKPVTFGLSYGAYPKKVAESIKCSLEEAEIIFNAYHNEMYPDITRFREQVLAYAKQHGYVHLGLGLRMYTSDPDKDVRTLFNACSQFWSIITLLSMADLYNQIDTQQQDVVINSTIYDALYGYVANDPATIKWLNDTIVPIMIQPWLNDEVVHNEANLEIGTSWADLHELPNNASLEQIEQILKEM